MKTARPDGIRKIVLPRNADVGGIPIRRVLPSIGLHSIGPWVFFDHFGPTNMSPGSGIDVPPHPHINLATVTYLFEGEIVHRDSIGSVQTIQPGAINLMNAGSGIAHSERTGEKLRSAGHHLHGLQLWLALPEEFEESEPAFYHFPASDLPLKEIEGCSIRIMMGCAYGELSPVRTFSDTLYFEATLQNGAEIILPVDSGQIGVYPVTGRFRLQGYELPTMGMILCETGGTIRADTAGKMVIIGGHPLGTRHMWWNFVSSKKDRIEKAKVDWREKRLPPIPGETGYVPLPEYDSFFDGR